MLAEDAIQMALNDYKKKNDLIKPEDDKEKAKSSH
jgi:hypothetical protein